MKFKNWSSSVKRDTTYTVPCVLRRRKIQFCVAVVEHGYWEP